MPIYEFSCPNCGAEFEMVRSFSDSTMPACPKCAGTNVQRLLSRPAIHFKGSGWYINDSKSSNKTSAVGGSSNGEGEGAKSTDGAATDAKPAETTEKAAKPAETATTSKSEAPAAAATDKK